MKNLKWLISVCLPGLSGLALLSSVLLTSGFLASCGYKLAGGGYINDDVTKVFVRTLENKSSETNAGISFTNSLVRQIIQKTDTKVVDESKAMAFLEGTIKSITFRILSRSTTESVLERRVLAVVDLKLKDKDGKVIWFVKDFSSHEDYNVSSDKIADEANKRAAVEKIALRNAEKIVSKMQSNF